MKLHAIYDLASVEFKNIVLSNVVPCHDVMSER